MSFITGYMYFRPTGDRVADSYFRYLMCEEFYHNHIIFQHIIGDISATIYIRDRTQKDITTCDVNILSCLLVDFNYSDDPYAGNRDIFIYGSVSR